jgi:hypothetical protein
MAMVISDHSGDHFTSKLCKYACTVTVTLPHRNLCPSHTFVGLVYSKLVDSGGSGGGGGSTSGSGGGAIKVVIYCNTDTSNSLVV